MNAKRLIVTVDNVAPEINEYNEFTGDYIYANNVNSADTKDNYLYKDILINKDNDNIITKTICLSYDKDKVLINLLNAVNSNINTCCKRTVSDKNISSFVISDESYKKGSN